MKKDFQCDYKYKLAYSLLLAVCLLSKVKLRLSVHHAIKPQRYLLVLPSAMLLLPSAKKLSTLQHQRGLVVVANEVADVRAVDATVADTIEVAADAEAGLMAPANRLAQP